MNEAWLKQHWYYVAAAIVGILVLYEIVKSASGGATSSSSTTDLSGGGQQLQALTSAAAIQDAQTNATTTVAAYQASLQNNEAVLGAHVAETQIAAELAATQGTTQANENIQLGLGADAVTAQKIVTQGQVQQTQIEGATIDTLGAQSTSVKLAQVKNVNTQITNLMTYSKHFGSDIQALAPALLAETGQGGAAPGVEAGVSKSNQVATSTTGAVIGAGVSGLTKIFSGLFA